MSLWPNLRVQIGKRYENEASNASQVLFQSSKGFDKVGIPKKSCTLREQQLAEAERMKKFTINIYPFG